tara:strand:- start:655 stop:1536 length:882 start_codon:yes stop_codon:yes gene_type:complete
MNPLRLLVLLVSLPLLLGGCEKKPINNLRVDDFKVGDMVSVQTHKEILLPSGEVIKITPEIIYVEWTGENEYGFGRSEGFELPRDEVGKDTFLIPLEEKVLEVKEGAKPEESVAETKPKSELPRFMFDTEWRGTPSLVYLKGSADPYTGKVIGYYPHNQMKNIIQTFRNGVNDGLWTRWYEDGAKWQEKNYKNGEVDGLLTLWHTNGQIQVQREYTNGKQVDGLEITYYATGEKMREVNIVNGEREGLLIQWWYSSGIKRYEGNYKNGVLVKSSEKWWNKKGDPVDSFEEAFK